jgi:hypothetical protein
MDFIFDGQHHSLTKRQVDARMHGVEPDRIYQYSVEVNGVRYPVKQVFRVATGLKYVNTDRARDILRRLGFFSVGAPSATASQPSTVAELSRVWVLEIQTVAGGVHEIELDHEEDLEAFEAELSNRIGSDGSYHGRSRRADAVGGASTITIAWKHVAAASLYQRQDRLTA